jgi:hypothetical protein
MNEHRLKESRRGMNYLFSCSVVVCSALALAQNAPKDCTPTTPLGKQSRSELKHRKPDPGTPEVTTIPQVLNWQQPAALSSRVVRESNKSIDDRENKDYVVDGNLWRVGLEGNDCDLHLELSDAGKGKSAERVIVEIPQEYASTRDELLALLPERERSRIMNARPNSKGNYRPVNLTSSLRIRVTGYAFYDAYHYLARWQTSKPGRCDFSPEQLHQRGKDHGTCNVGTIWELHPVWKVERLR